MGGLLARLLCRAGLGAGSRRRGENRAQLRLARNPYRSDQCRGARDLRAHQGVPAQGRQHGAALLRSRARAQPQSAVHLGAERAELLLSRRPRHGAGAHKALPYFWLFENPASIAHLMKREYEEAVEIARRVVENTPAYGNGYKPLIAALGHLRRRKEAKRYVDRLLEIEPAFTVKRFGE